MTLLVLVQLSTIFFSFRCSWFRLKMPTAVEEETPETVDDVISGLSPGASTSSGSSWTTTSQRSVGQKMVSSRSSRPTPTAYQRLSILVDFDSRASHSLPLSLSLSIFRSLSPSLFLSLSLSPSHARSYCSSLSFSTLPHSTFSTTLFLMLSLPLAVKGIVCFFGVSALRANNRTTEQTDKRTNGQTEKGSAAAGANKTDTGFRVEWIRDWIEENRK